MNKLLQAMTTGDTITTNGMIAHSTTSSHVLDYFSTLGISRDVPAMEIINKFTKSFSDDPLTTMRLLFYGRDVRGGQGERYSFRNLIAYLANNRSKVLLKNIHLIPEYGRWDDLLVLMNTPCEKQALELWANAIRSKNGLAAKWAPREGSANGQVAYLLARQLGLNMKEYRKLISSLSKTVEQDMCAKNWDEINFEQVPSVAMSNYKKAFERNATTWQDYVSRLIKGTAKINGSILYPYQIVKSISSNPDIANAQWETLPDYISSDERILPIVDVSGSMWSTAGQGFNCIDISTSLGLYLCERNKSAFKDAIITFEHRPHLVTLRGTLTERYNQLLQVPWGGSTDLNAVFELVLNHAVKYKVPESDMPTALLIVSDMQFNCCGQFTAVEMIREKYRAAGYTMPRIIFWQVNGSINNTPVKFDERGVGIVSGFSPSIMKYALGSTEMFDPMQPIRDIVESERYKDITV